LTRFSEVSRQARLVAHIKGAQRHEKILNQTEIRFNIFARAVPKGGTWKSKAELVAQIMKYIKHYNKNQAHPFIPFPRSCFRNRSMKAMTGAPREAAHDFPPDKGGSRGV
jgi:hypothetical protein